MTVRSAAARTAHSRIRLSGSSLRMWRWGRVLRTVAVLLMDRRRCWTFSSDHWNFVWSLLVVSVRIAIEVNNSNVPRMACCRSASVKFAAGESLKLRMTFS